MMRVYAIYNLERDRFLCCTWDQVRMRYYWGQPDGKLAYCKPDNVDALMNTRYTRAVKDMKPRGSLDISNFLKRGNWWKKVWFVPVVVNNQKAQGEFNFVGAERP